MPQMQKINIDFQGINYVSASVTIAAKDWEEIVAFVDKLNIKTLHEIETTNVESAVDRARIANVVVTLNNKQYESASFDEGNSPKKLEPLINKILALAKTVEQQ